MEIVGKNSSDSIENNALLHKDNSEWNFEKRPGMLYVVVRAISVGTNGNGDHFTYDELKRAWPTFIGKGVFVNHQSSDIEKKRGKIVDAKFVEDGTAANAYVKTVLEVNAEAYPDLASQIRCGIVDSVSMGAVYDTGLEQLVTMEDLNAKSYFDMVVGDKVVTHDGSMSEVVAVGKEWHNQRDSYTIKAMKIKPICLSEEHPLLVLRKENKNIKNASEFVEAKDIKIGDYLLSNIYSKIEKSNITINEAKLLGWYLAEGSLCDKIGINFVLNINDPIEEIKSLIESIDQIATIHVYKHSTSLQALNIVFYSKKIRDLIEKNIFGKSKDKSLSSEILDMEPEKQLALIGSYIDGDGCLASNRVNKNVAISISTSSEKLANQIPLILERSGILVSVHSTNRKPGKNSVVKNNFIQHTIFIGTSFVDNLRNHSIKAAKIKLTKSPCKRSFVYENYVAVPIKSIEKKKYTGWAYNIQVSSDENKEFKGNHSYHLNGIASHNCQVAYSNCSVCRHKAKTTKDYCFHVRSHKGGAYDGRPVYEENHGVEFIEVSFVTTGADSQAKVLQIIARQARMTNENVLRIWAKASSDASYIARLDESQKNLSNIVVASIREANKLRGE